HFLHIPDRRSPPQSPGPERDRRARGEAPPGPTLTVNSRFHDQRSVDRSYLVRVTRRTVYIAARRQRRSPIASRPTAPRPGRAESGSKPPHIPEFSRRDGPDGPATGPPFPPPPAIRMIGAPALRSQPVLATRSFRSP